MTTQYRVRYQRLLNTSCHRPEPRWGLDFPPWRSLHQSWRDSSSGSPSPTKRRHAQFLIRQQVPTIFPGPLCSVGMAQCGAGQQPLRHRSLFETLKGMRNSPGPKPMLIRMPDHGLLRHPKFNFFSCSRGLNPNQPQFTIWHNKTRLLHVYWSATRQSGKLCRAEGTIRGGTSCYTVAMCAQRGRT